MIIRLASIYRKFVIQIDKDKFSIENSKIVLPLHFIKNSRSERSKFDKITNCPTFVLILLSAGPPRLARPPRPRPCLDFQNRKRQRQHAADVATTVGLLICTLISENQGLEKSRSASNLRKFQVLQILDFFFNLSPRFFSDLYYKPSFFSRWRPRKKSRFAGTEFFSTV